MTKKEKHIKRITFIKDYVYDLIGETCGIFPGNKLRLGFTDTTNKIVYIEESSFNVTENPATGKTDIVIRLTVSGNNPMSEQQEAM